MRDLFRLSVVGHILFFLASIIGCGGDSPRVVQETDEYRFDDIAAQAAAETELSEAEE